MRGECVSGTRMYVNAYRVLLQLIEMDRWRTFLSSPERVHIF